MIFNKTSKTLCLHLRSDKITQFFQNDSQKILMKKLKNFEQIYLKRIKR
jgi:hypothetical protein